MVKTDSVDLYGNQTERALEKAHITCNKNMIPGDKRSPFITSGIRLGTPALTTRGMKEKEMELIASWITKVLKNHEDENVISTVREEVLALCQQFPVY